MPPTKCTVIKIQSGNWNNLTADKEEACTILRKADEVATAAEDTLSSESPVKMKDRIKRIKLSGLQRESKKNPYHDFSFLFASAAEVERVWSKALYVFVQQRRKMHPQLLEALLFLKENKRFWDKATVLVAIRMLNKKDEEQDDDSVAGMEVDLEDN